MLGVPRHCIGLGVRVRTRVLLYLYQDFLSNGSTDTQKTVVQTVQTVVTNGRKMSLNIRVQKTESGLFFFKLTNQKPCLLRENKCSSFNMDVWESGEYKQ